MKYSMKFAGILNETGPTLNENAFHSSVVAKQIFFMAAATITLMQLVATSEATHNTNTMLIALLLEMAMESSLL